MRPDAPAMLARPAITQAGAWCVVRRRIEWGDRPIVPKNGDTSAVTRLHDVSANRSAIVDARSAMRDGHVRNALLRCGLLYPTHTASPLLPACTGIGPGMSRNRGPASAECAAHRHTKISKLPRPIQPILACEPPRPHRPEYGATSAEYENHLTGTGHVSTEGPDLREAPNLALLTAYGAV